MEENMDRMSHYDDHLKTCKRCGDEKKVNRHGLCTVCESEVDHEYAMMYETSSKES